MDEKDRPYSVAVTLNTNGVAGLCSKCGLYIRESEGHIYTEHQPLTMDFKFAGKPTNGELRHLDC